MTSEIIFAKLSGSGNDFICVDNRDGRFNDLLGPDRAGDVAQVLCRRGMAVGADGLIIAEPCEEGIQADIGVRFYEPDGSQAELCGNGTACFVRWVVSNGWLEDREIRILSQAGLVHGRNVDAQYVQVCIPSPKDIQHDFLVQALGQSYTCDFAVTGVPHVITYVRDVNQVEVDKLGAALRHHSRFHPRGANANFVQVIEPGRLALRTFEFGVEHETLACGTGAAAAAILAGVRFDWPEKHLSGKEPVQVKTRGGDVMRIYFTRQADGGFIDVCLQTRVRFVYHGRLGPDMLAAISALPPSGAVHAQHRPEL
jgi:diaminopimelate epimerase